MGGSGHMTDLAPGTHFFPGMDSCPAGMTHHSDNTNVPDHVLEQRNIDFFLL